MKKVLISSLISVISVLGAIAQPMPNQNPHGATGGSVSNAPTTSSISTLSVDHNEILMIGLSLLVVASIFMIANKKSVKA